MALLPLGMLYLASGISLVQLSLGGGGDGQAAFQRAQQTTTLPARRGAILDRHGAVLAEDRSSWKLTLPFRPEHRGFVHGVEQGDLDAAAAVERVEAIAEGLGLPFASTWQALMVQPGASQVLLRGLTPTEADAARHLLSSPKLRNSGLRLEQEFERVYPNGPVLSHLVGLQVEESSLAEEDRGLQSTGFEGGLQQVLQGVDGMRATIGVRGKHGVNPALEKRNAIPGRDVRTSLDLELSHFAREQLLALMEEHDPWHCLAIAVDAHSGQVLTMQGLPDYDPRDPMPSLTERIDPYSGEEAQFGWVLPAKWYFEPGSSFKPLVAAYALHRGDIGPQQQFPDHGGAFRPPGRLRSQPITNARGVPSGPLRAFEGIVESSNIVFAQVARAVGREGMADMLDYFGYSAQAYSLPGLAQRFDGRLLPERKVFLRERGPDGMAYVIPTMGYGHGFDVSPLDHALAHAAVANGGKLLQPTFNPDAEPVVRQRILDPTTLEYVRDAMHGMVHKPSRKQLPHREEMNYCGKSGTAKIKSGVFLDRYTSTFVAFGPYEDPEVVVLVVAFGTRKGGPAGANHFGSKVCGPAAGEILHRALQLRGSLPENRPGHLDSRPSPATLNRGNR